MKAISIIQAEHRNLGAVLLCFKALLSEIEKKDATPDFQLFHAILHYLDSFLGRFHHPKEEEYLFPAICRRYPKAENVVQGVAQEHIEGVELLKALRTALFAYESSAASAFTTFQNAASNYIDFERQHAYKEERELLPLAREHLMTEDWEPLDAAFSANNDPLFGQGAKKQYAQLSKLILNISLFGDPFL